MGPYVPPGQSPPFEVVDEFHHGAFIIITVALGLVVSLACLLIRVYVRLMLIPPFAHDDLVLLGATIVGISQSILVFYACSRGFGTSLALLEATRLNQVQTLIATSDILALIVIYLSKCCVIAIYLRLTPQKPHNRASWGTFALCTAWLVPAICILLINCELNQPWRMQGSQCRNLYERWQFIAAVDIITELILFVLAVALLKGLFMSVKRKLGIGFAFLFRFPLIIFTLLHISTLHTALSDTDVTLAAVEPTLWLQVEVHYALVACSVFCLRPFMAAVSTNYGTAGDSNLESSASASRSRGTNASSKSGSGSGSNSASRSRSLSRMQRKITGTKPRAGRREKHPRSSSRERLCHDENREGHWDDSVPVRAPVHRSMFPLSTPGQPIAVSGKSKSGGARGWGLRTAQQALDSIELMPQLHRQHGRQENSRGMDQDKMVIRKEVGYSVELSQLSI